MAALENRRHECFALLLAAMKPVAEAYLMAGYAEGSSYKDNARKLANSPAIKVRVVELQGAVAEKLVDVSAEWLQQRVARIAGAEVSLNDVRASDVVAAARLLAQMIPGALAPQKIAPTDADGDGPARLEISWLDYQSGSATPPAPSSDPSMSERSASPASSPTGAPVRPSPASTISSAPLFGVRSSDLDSPT